MPRTVAENIEEVRSRIAAAATRSGRKESDVRLIAVTKYVGLAELLQIVKTGITDLGESRPQHLWKVASGLQATAPDLAKNICWHMIGHLQTNKIAQTLSLVEMIHSGDRIPLIEAIHKVSQKQNLRTKLLLEVNISRDESKHGFAPREMDAVLGGFRNFNNVEVCGMMGMSGLESNDDDRRREFASLRDLRDRLQKSFPTFQLRELSMGMSDDYEIAIEEGATMVRVGSALIEGIEDST